MKSRRTVTTFRRALIAASAALALVLAGCSGSDDPEATGNAAADTSASSSDDAAADSGGDSSGGTLDDALDTVGMGTMLEIAGDQITGQYGFDGYEIDGNTISFTRSAGTVADDAEMDCMQADLILGMVTDDDFGLVMEYGDGTVDCHAEETEPQPVPTVETAAAPTPEAEPEPEPEPIPLAEVFATAEPLLQSLLGGAGFSDIAVDGETLVITGESDNPGNEVNMTYCTIVLDALRSETHSPETNATFVYPDGEVDCAALIGG